MSLGSLGAASAAMDCQKETFQELIEEALLLYNLWFPTSPQRTREPDSSAVAAPTEIMQVQIPESSVVIEPNETSQVIEELPQEGAEREYLPAIRSPIRNILPLLGDDPDPGPSYIPCTCDLNERPIRNLRRKRVGEVDDVPCRNRICVAVERLRPLVEANGGPSFELIRSRTWFGTGNVS